MFTFSANTLMKSSEFNQNFTDLSDGTGDTTVNSLKTFRDEVFSDFVLSGGVWTGDSYAVNRNGSMSSMILFINGRRISISAVVARNFTASKDTYVDVLDNLDGTGTLVYTEVANGAAAPALAANSLRNGIVVTTATTILAATSITQSSTDSLSNYVYPSAPDMSVWRIIGRFKLSVAGDTITVSNLPARKYLKVEVSLISSGAYSAGLRFNADSGSNYSYGRNLDGAAISTGVSGASFEPFGSKTVPSFTEFNVLNILNQEKLFTGQAISQGTAGAGNVISTSEFGGKWVNTTTQITGVSCNNGLAGDFSIGSEIVVWGKD